MNDYIKREDAIKILLQRREFAENQDWTQEADLMELLLERLDELPSADVREVVRGRWIEFPAALAYKDAYCDTHIVCSACEAVFDIMDNCTERFNFCPNCGADMSHA